MPEPMEPPIWGDDTLLAAVELARAALEEITPADTIGDPVGHIWEGEQVVSLLFACALSGYPGWRWTVSLARTDEDAVPTVLETELTPGDDALLAPEWVPWSDRLAEATAADALGDGALDDDDEIDDDEIDNRADDTLDGVDFSEAEALAAQPYPDETDDAEPDTDEGAPQPPAEALSDEFVPKKKRSRKRAQPQD